MAAPYSLTPAHTNSALGGYYFTRGVVTFNDRVLNTDCLFIQDGGPPFLFAKWTRPCERSSGWGWG